MNELFTISEQKSTLTMSSREIAELVESRHDHVKRSIERLADKGVIQLPPLEEVKNHLGQTVTEYHLIKRDTYIVVAQLCPEFTARLVDRWQALESQQKPTALLPQNYLQALEALVEAEKQKQQLALENAQLKPKANFVDHYIEVGTSKSFREVAKILKMPERAMINWLIEDRFLYRQSGVLLPYQTAHSRDLFTVKTGTAEHGHNFTQTRVTSKGIEFIASRYASELMQ